MKNKKGNVGMIAIIIVVVAITAGIMGWTFAKKSQAPTSQIAADITKQTEEEKIVETNFPVAQENYANKTDALPLQPAEVKKENIVQSDAAQTSPAQTNSKSAIMLTIKDSGGKPLKGITCAVKADEGASRMIPEISEKSDSKGVCNFQNLDPTLPYLVRVYWTSDKSRVSDISLSWIPAGTIEKRTIINPY